MRATNEIIDAVWEIVVREDRERGMRYRAYLIDGDTPTLVDTGFEDTTDALFGGLDDIGVTPERVVITHGDPDHIGGLDRIVRRFDPEAWISHETLRVLDRDVAADCVFSDGDRVAGFEALHIPGHGPDTYALVDEQRSVAVMGDVLVGSDLRGLPAGYFHLPANWKELQPTNDIDEAIEHLPKLLDYEFEVGLVFHGENVVEDASEKLQRYLTP